MLIVGEFGRLIEHLQSAFLTQGRVCSAGECPFCARFKHHPLPEQSLVIDFGGVDIDAVVRLDPSAGADSALLPRKFGSQVLHHQAVGAEIVVVEIGSHLRGVLFIEDTGIVQVSAQSILLLVVIDGRVVLSEKLIINALEGEVVRRV